MFVVNNYVDSRFPSIYITSLSIDHNGSTMISPTRASLVRFETTSSPAFPLFATRMAAPSLVFIFHGLFIVIILIRSSVEKIRRLKVNKLLLLVCHRQIHYIPALFKYYHAMLRARFAYLIIEPLLQSSDF